MITLQLADIFIVYISATILGILLTYLYTAIRYGYKKRPIVEDRLVVNCPVCAYTYIVDGIEKIHKCPQCESLNK